MESSLLKTTKEVPSVSWKDLQYPPGSTGHRKLPKPPSNKFKQMEYVTKILGSKVYDVAIESPLQFAPLLSTQMGNNLWLKREDSQQIFSFKIRGAYNMISQLPKDKLKNGVICASAGNQAQGVALAALHVKCKAFIVMPESTPPIKIDAVKRLEGRVELLQGGMREATERAKQRSEEEDLVFIPSDGNDIIAGQGTIGVEISRQMRDKIHAIFVPVGSGSLACGVASFYKLFFPDVLIFGVEPNDSNAMAQALHRNEIVHVYDISDFAEGVAIPQVGPEAFRICNELLDDVIYVNKKSICIAIRDVFNETRSILEPSGALSIAAAKAYCEYNKIKGKNIVAVSTGANINFDQLGKISDIANHKDQSILASILPEKPGSLKKLINLVDNNITEMAYRISSGSQDALLVYRVLAVGSELEKLVERLNSSGFKTHTWSDNSVVTEHLRYLVGGRADVENEILLCFTFPEKAGALKYFLKGFQSNWNISLLHHRQEGINTSDVLIGVQLEESEEIVFHDYLKKVGYKYEKISPDNSAHILAKV